MAKIRKPSKPSKPRKPLTAAVKQKISQGLARALGPTRGIDDYQPKPKTSTKKHKPATPKTGKNAIPDALPNSQPLTRKQTRTEGTRPQPKPQRPERPKRPATLKELSRAQLIDGLEYHRARGNTDSYNRIRDELNTRPTPNAKTSTADTQIDNDQRILQRYEQRQAELRLDREAEARAILEARGVNTDEWELIDEDVMNRARKRVERDIEKDTAQRQERRQQREAEQARQQQILQRQAEARVILEARGQDTSNWEPIDPELVDAARLRLAESIANDTTARNMRQARNTPTPTTPSTPNTDTTTPQINTKAIPTVPKPDRKPEKQAPHPTFVEGGGHQASADYLDPVEIRKEPHYEDDLNKLNAQLAESPTAEQKLFNRLENAQQRASENRTNEENRHNQREATRLQALAEDSGLIPNSRDNDPMGELDDQELDDFHAYMDELETRDAVTADTPNDVIPNDTPTPNNMPTTRPGMTEDEKDTQYFTAESQYDPDYEEFLEWQRREHDNPERNEADETTTVDTDTTDAPELSDTELEQRLNQRDNDDTTPDVEPENPTPPQPTNQPDTEPATPQPKTTGTPDSDGTQPQPEAPAPTPAPAATETPAPAPTPRREARPEPGTPDALTDEEQKEFDKQAEKEFRKQFTNQSDEELTTELSQLEPTHPRAQALNRELNLRDEDTTRQNANTYLRERSGRGNQGKRQPANTGETPDYNDHNQLEQLETAAQQDADRDQFNTQELQYLTFDELDAIDTTNLDPTYAAAVDDAKETINPEHPGGILDSLKTTTTFTDYKRRLTDYDGLENYLQEGEDLNNPNKDERAALNKRIDDRIKTNLGLAGNPRFAREAEQTEEYFDWENDLFTTQTNNDGTIDDIREAGGRLKQGQTGRYDTVDNAETQISTEVREHIINNIGYLPNIQNFQRIKRGEAPIPYTEDTAKEIRAERNARARQRPYKTKAQRAAAREQKIFNQNTRAPELERRQAQELQPVEGLDGVGVRAGRKAIMQPDLPQDMRDRPWEKQERIDLIQRHADTLNDKDLLQAVDNAKEDNNFNLGTPDIEETYRAEATKRGLIDTPETPAAPKVDAPKPTKAPAKKTTAKAPAKPAKKTTKKTTKATQKPELRPIPPTKPKPATKPEPTKRETTAQQTTNTPTADLQELAQMKPNELDPDTRRERRAALQELKKRGITPQTPPAAAKPAAPKKTDTTKPVPVADEKLLQEYDNLTNKPQNRMTDADKTRTKEIETTLQQQGYTTTRQGTQHPDHQPTLDQYNKTAKEMTDKHGDTVTPEYVTKLKPLINKLAELEPHNKTTWQDTLDELKTKANMPKTTPPQTKNTTEAVQRRTKLGTNADLVIEHDEENGTIITGTNKNDGTADTLKKNGWRWSRTLQAWYVPRSRDNAPKDNIINNTSDQLEKQGFSVGNVIDRTKRTAQQREDAKTQRAKERATALQQRADNKTTKAQQATDNATNKAKELPQGAEPVKIGHHSEKRHRTSINKANAAQDRATEATKDAQQAQAKAQAAKRSEDTRTNPITVGNRIERLQNELRKLENNGSPKEKVDEWRDNLTYWQGIRNQQIKDGLIPNANKDTINIGDEVTIRSSKTPGIVTKLNDKTIQVQDPGQRPRTYKYHEITKHTPAEAKKPAAKKPDEPQPTKELTAARKELDANTTLTKNGNTYTHPNGTTIEPYDSTNDGYVKFTVTSPNGDRTNRENADEALQAAELNTPKKPATTKTTTKPTGTVSERAKAHTKNIDQKLYKAKTNFDNTRQNHPAGTPEFEKAEREYLELNVQSATQHRDFEQQELDTRKQNGQPTKAQQKRLDRTEANLQKAQQQLDTLNEIRDNSAKTNTTTPTTHKWNEPYKTTLTDGAETHYYHTTDWNEPHTPTENMAVWNSQRPLQGQYTWQGQGRYGQYYAATHTNHADYTTHNTNNLNLDSERIELVDNTQSLELADQRLQDLRGMTLQQALDNGATERDLMNMLGLPYNGTEAEKQRIQNRRRELYNQEQHQAPATDLTAGLQAAHRQQTIGTPSRFTDEGRAATEKFNREHPQASYEELANKIREQEWADFQNADDNYRAVSINQMKDRNALGAHLTDEYTDAANKNGGFPTTIANTPAPTTSDPQTTPPGLLTDDNLIAEYHRLKGDKQARQADLGRYGNILTQLRARGLAEIPKPSTSGTSRLAKLTQSGEELSQRNQTPTAPKHLDGIKYMGQTPTYDAPNPRKKQERIQQVEKTTSELAKQMKHGDEPILVKTGDAGFYVKPIGKNEYRVWAPGKEYEAKTVRYDEPGGARWAPFYTLIDQTTPQKHTHGEQFTNDHKAPGESINPSGSLRRGDYNIISTPDGYQIIENFGRHKITKPYKQTLSAIRKKIDQMPGKP